MEMPSLTPDLILRDFLASHDVPCPNCGYNLRGITTSTCPECSRPLRLQLAGSDPLRRLYWIGWTTIAATLLTNAWGVVQWLQILGPSFNSSMFSMWQLSIWVGLIGNVCLFILGILWVIFALGRSWPSPRPPVGNPVFVACVWLLASSCIYFLTSILRLLGL